MNCGACGAECVALSHVTTAVACRAGRCVLEGACEPGFADKDCGRQVVFCPGNCTSPAAGKCVITKNDAFDFILLCNKICGASHYNMQMPLVVTDAAAHKAWYADAMKKPFQAPPAAPAPPVAPTPDSTATATTTPVAQAQPTH